MGAGASALVTIPFVVVALLMAAMLAAALVVAGAWGVRARIAFALWTLVPLALAGTGVLGRWDRLPPPFAVVTALVTIATVVTALRVGPRLVTAVPLWVLVLTQGFRLPLELVMHQAAVEDVMPGQMTWTGWNYDILTGITAIVLGLWLRSGRPPRAIVQAWNALGFLLLLNVVSVAVVSLPPFARFGPDAVNTWVATSPFIWLPSLLVQAALAGHLLVWRSLRQERA
jgi:hypothetical protein